MALTMHGVQSLRGESPDHLWIGAVPFGSLRSLRAGSRAKAVPAQTYLVSDSDEQIPIRPFP